MVWKAPAMNSQHEISAHLLETTDVSVEDVTSEVAATKPTVRHYGTVSRHCLCCNHVQRPRGWGARHTLAVMGCLGFFVSFCLRVNISMAIVAMVNHTALAMETQLPTAKINNNYSAANSSGNTDVCGGGDLNEEQAAVTEDGPFVWGEMLQGVILSAYFIGYTVSQIPGGRLAESVGAARTFGLGIFSTALLNLLTPIFTMWSVYALIAIRILQGVTSGVTCPAIHFMLSRWVPPGERSRISTFVYIGKQLGTAVAILIAGPLASARAVGGWSAIFYVTGTVGVVWYLFWLLLVHETPGQHPRIQREERVYIDAYFRPPVSPGQKLSFPWAKVLTSGPVWALVTVHFCQNWGDYMIMTELPTYISTILHYPLSSNALFSALPQLVKIGFALGVSCMSDFLVNRGLNITTSRKLWNSIGMYVPALLMAGVAYSGCNDVLVICLVVGTVGFNGAIFSGYNINHMDLAPNFAGTLMGLTNCIATLAGVLAPSATGYIINGQPSLANWRVVFLMAAGFFALGSTIFCLFGTAKQQRWNQRLGNYSSNLNVAHRQTDSKQKKSSSQLTYP